MHGDAGASLRPAAALGGLGVLATFVTFFFVAGLAMSGASPGRGPIGYDVVATLPPWVASGLFAVGAAVGAHRLAAHWRERRRPLAAAAVGVEAVAGVGLSAVAADATLRVLDARGLPGRIPPLALTLGALALLAVAAGCYAALARTAPRFWPAGRVVVSAIITAAAATALMLWWLSADQQRRQAPMHEQRYSTQPA